MCKEVWTVHSTTASFHPGVDLYTGTCTLTVPQIPALHHVSMVVPVEMVPVIVFMVTLEVTANTMVSVAMDAPVSVGG